MSIIMFMTNDLTNICNEIITIRLPLRMAYTRNVKGLVIGEKTMHFTSYLTIPLNLKPFRQWQTYHFWAATPKMEQHFRDCQSRRITNFRKKGKEIIVGN